MSTGAIAELRAAYAAGTTDPVTVVGAVYDRIDASGLRPAWISLVPLQDALARAAAADLTLPLGGVPFAVKDNIDVAGLVTTAGCPGAARTATATATAVQRLLDAGAILVGKTNLDQFATGLVGTRSPYGTVPSAVDARFVAGGSSSGSAVVVAQDVVPFALGTDTAGSGRVPAAFNGIVGLKPTRGLVSTRGVVPACPSLDCVSVFTTCVTDARAVLEVLAGFDPDDPWSRHAPHTSPARDAADRAPRIGVPRADQLPELDARLRDAWTAAVDHATVLGCGPAVAVDVAPLLETATLLYDGPWLAERWAAVGAFVQGDVEGLDPVVAQVVQGGAAPTALDAFRGVHRLAELRRATERALQHVDVLLLPTAPTVPTPDEVAADPIGVNRLLGRWTNAVNLLDLSALAVPAGRGEDGLPFGVTLIARAFAEPLLLTVGAAWTGEASVVPATAPPTASDEGIRLAVVGAHLRGQPLEHQLRERGARFVRATRSACDYRLVALPGGPPWRPGLVRVPGSEGPGIELEIVAIPPHGLGSLLATVPPPLAIGTVELDDGEQVLGFLCEAHAADDAQDITAFGGWRAFLASAPVS